MSLFASSSYAVDPGAGVGVARHLAVIEIQLSRRAKFQIFSTLLKGLESRMITFSLNSLSKVDASILKVCLFVYTFDCFDF